MEGINSAKNRKRQASEPAVSSDTSFKRQRVLLTLERKVALLRESENVGVTQSALSEKYGIGRSSVGDILKRQKLNSFVRIYEARLCK